MRKTINKTAIFGALGICFIGFGGCAGTLEEVKNAGRPPAPVSYTHLDVYKRQG